MRARIGATLIGALLAVVPTAAARGADGAAAGKCTMRVKAPYSTVEEHPQAGELAMISVSAKVKCARSFRAHTVLDEMIVLASGKLYNRADSHARGRLRAGHWWKDGGSASCRGYDLDVPGDDPAVSVFVRVREKESDRVALSELCPDGTAVPPS
jgi:hypothetical protein